MRGHVCGQNTLNSANSTNILRDTDFGTQVHVSDIFVFLSFFSWLHESITFLAATEWESAKYSWTSFLESSSEPRRSGKASFTAELAKLPSVYLGYFSP